MSELLDAIVPALGLALLHFLWQGVLIGAIAAAALALLRDARPQVRYAVACAALLACVLVPLATFIAYVMPAAPVVEAAAPGRVTLATVAVQAMAHASPAGLATPEGESRLPGIVMMWAAGACLMLLRTAWGLAWLRGLQPVRPDPRQAPWQARLDALAAAFGLGPVELRLVDALDTPAAIGWWRPVVLLPTALLARMPVDLVEALLAHELAHVRRHDFLVNLLQSAVEALGFYHPVVWWLSRRIRVEREQIADRLAVEVACPPRRLALALSTLADLRRDAPFPDLALAAHGGQLMSRIRQLMKPADASRPGARLALSSLALAAACVASLTYAHAARDGKVPVAAPVPAVAPVAPVTVVSSRPAPAAVPAVPAVRTEHDTFALVGNDADAMTLWGDTDNIPAIQAARHAVSGEFLWAGRGDRAWVVSDPATLARARALMREPAAIDAKMEALGTQMEVHGRKMEAIGARMESVAVADESSPAAEQAMHEMEALSREQEALGRKQEALGRRMESTRDEAQWQAIEAERDALETEQEAIERRHDALAERLDAEGQRLEARQAPLEALSREMELAQQPMEALSAQMETLSEQHELLELKAERELRALLDEAITRGLARPARLQVHLD